MGMWVVLGFLGGFFLFAQPHVDGIDHRIAVFEQFEIGIADIQLVLGQIWDLDGGVV